MCAEILAQTGDSTLHTAHPADGIRQPEKRAQPYVRANKIWSAPLCNPLRTWALALQASCGQLDRCVDALSLGIGVRVEEVDVQRRLHDA